MYKSDSIKELYFSFFKNFNSKYTLTITDKDIEVMTSLTLDAFELDDVFDRQMNSEDKTVPDIKDRMELSLGEEFQISRSEVNNLINSHFDEFTYIPRNLNEYLKLTGKNIGAQIISGFLADKAHIENSVWISESVSSFNNIINIILRLANDYLDLNEDKVRISSEVGQIKAGYFIHRKFTFKFLILRAYVLHKIRYIFYKIRFFILRNKKYFLLYSILEVPLDLGFKYYFVMKESGRNRK